MLPATEGLRVWETMTEDRKFKEHWKRKFRILLNLKATKLKKGQKKE